MSEILIIDDERSVREGIRALLRGEGHEVRTASAGEKGLEEFKAKRPDLVLLDVMMPGLNGFAVCERLRAADRTVPIVFLTAKDGEADEVRGLGLGADDFISKTTGEAALLARIRRALERNEAADATPCDNVCLGRVTVDFVSRRVFVGSDETARLTATESSLLRLLSSSPGRVFSNVEICDALYGRGSVCDAATLRSHVSHLKDKLGVAGEMIVTDRGAGYRMVR